MTEQDNRVSKFFDAINSDAQERQAEIEHRLNQRKIDAIASARQKAEEESRATLAREMKKIDADASRKLAAHSAENRLRLAEKRSEIADRVFAAAKEKLCEFAGGNDYQAFLAATAKKAEELFAVGNVTFLMRESDLALSTFVADAYSGSCSFETDASIKIGGLKIRNADGSCVADDTLDTRLEEQRKWFFENSGLTVRKA